MKSSPIRWKMKSFVNILLYPSLSFPLHYTSYMLFNEYVWAGNDSFTLLSIINTSLLRSLKAQGALHHTKTEHYSWLPCTTALTCQKVLNSSNQRLAISRSYKISFCLVEKIMVSVKMLSISNKQFISHWQLFIVECLDRCACVCVCIVWTFCVVIIHTPIRTSASALASSVWGKWRFISSPSKSAL